MGVPITVNRAVFGLAALALTTPLAGQHRERSLETIAPGVHVIVHRDATTDWPQGNTTVIEGDSAVLVVDAAYLPSAAREDISAIRALTSKPVRWLVNTHWHYDHNNGNAEYLEAIEGLTIVAHRETKRIMDVNGPGYFASVLDSAGPSWRALTTLRSSLASGTGAAGRPLTPDEREALALDIRARENERSEFAEARYAGPTLTFDAALSLQLGGREVVVAHAGRGNTPGDAYVWLPAERILVTGDLLVAPVPFPFNSFPSPWIRVLGSLAGLGAEVIVPGHGRVMRDTAYLERVRDLLADAVAQAEALGRARVPVEEAILRIDLEPHRARFTGGDPTLDLWFDALVGALPERAYREARGQLEE